VKQRLFLAGSLALVATLTGQPVTADPPEAEAQFGQVYAETPSGPLKADLYLPAGEGPFPGVLLVHGGAWRMGTRAQMSGLGRLLSKHGYTAVAISYRLAPDHKFPAQIEDCQTALRWMRREASRLKLDPLRIAGFGYSAGAQLVALLGTAEEDFDFRRDRPPGSAIATSQTTTSVASTPEVSSAGADDPPCRLQAVVAGGTPCDFRPIPLDDTWLAFWLGGSRREQGEIYRLASPAAFVSPDDPPMFFFHGENDELVPLVSPQTMCRRLHEAGVAAQLHVAPRLGHGATAVDPESIRLAIDFLDEQLHPENGRPALGEGPASLVREP
jgi:acetyl esterase/lipase